MRICRFLVPIAAAILSVLPALSQTEFQFQQYPTPKNDPDYVKAPNAHSADFNEDGLADVLVPDTYYVCTSTASGITCTVRFALYLYLDNGTGLNAPVQLPIAPTQTSFADFAISDFNGDGHLDVAVLSSSGALSLLYGHGDGTFANPVTIQLAASNFGALVEADFDGNNTQDLAALDLTGKLTLLFNDGKGNFTQQQVQLDTPPSGFTTVKLEVGDFNADGRPDLAWVEQGDANQQQNTVWSALNTANGVFSAKNEAGSLPAGFGNLLAADLDLDGRSDLIAWATQLSENCCTDLPISLYYSNGDGRFTASTLDTTYTTDIGVTDLNGDGNPDIVLTSFQGLTAYSGNGDRTFTRQGTDASLPGGPGLIGIGFYDSTNRIGLTATNLRATSDTYNNYLYEVLNDYVQGDCAYPSTPGVTFCSATQSGNTVTVRGTARAQTQPVRHIEVWANGMKMYQVFSDEFDATLTLPAGTQITAIEVEANGVTRSATTTAKSGGACAAPDSPGVNVCSPTAGQTVSSSVTFTAAGTGASGSVNHLELWIDGNKVGNYTGSTLNASTTLANGSHSTTVIEVDSNGAYVKSTPVTFTVASNAGPCAAPSSPGVNVCSPTTGQTVSSPVEFAAAGTGASGSVNHLELWIDGNKIGNYNGSTLSASTTLASGSHTAVVIEVDSKGAYVRSTPVTFTVM